MDVLRAGGSAVEAATKVKIAFALQAMSNRIPYLRVVNMGDKPGMNWHNFNIRVEFPKTELFNKKKLMNMLLNGDQKMMYTFTTNFFHRQLWCWRTQVKQMLALEAI